MVSIPSLSQGLQISFRLLHLVSAMLACSNIAIFALLPPEDISDLTFIRTKAYKNLVYFSGLVMIFSGILLLIVMRQNLTRSFGQRGKDSQEMQVWVGYFPIKFFLTIATTPFIDRLIKIYVLGISSKASSLSASHDPQDFYDTLSTDSALYHRELDRSIALFKTLMILVLYGFSSYIKHYREQWSTSLDRSQQQEISKMLDQMMYVQAMQREGVHKEEESYDEEEEEVQPGKVEEESEVDEDEYDDSEDKQDVQEDEEEEEGQSSSSSSLSQVHEEGSDDSQQVKRKRD